MDLQSIIVIGQNQRMIFKIHVSKWVVLKTGYFQTLEELFVIFRSKPACSLNDLKVFLKTFLQRWCLQVRERMTRKTDQYWKNKRRWCRCQKFGRRKILLGLARSIRHTIFCLIKMTDFSCLSLLKTVTPVHSAEWKTQSWDHNRMVSANVAVLMLCFS